jgi:aryl-alcohol dehydrogenase-like predicted oxidoreductase
VTTSTTEPNAPQAPEVRTEHLQPERLDGGSLRFKILGTSGLRVSEIGLGTMSFGDAWGFGAGERESHRILAAYAEAGGNFIDTANKYNEGQSEEILGRFLGAERDRWVVASKYTLAMRSGDPNAAGNSRKNMRQSVDASLRRLRTDYLDVLFVHAWDFTTPVEEVMRGLDDLVSAGKVNYVALSDAPAWIASQANTLAALRGWSPFVALQLEYSLIERTAERELLPVAEAFGLSIMAWAPMGGGVLTGKYSHASSETPVDTKRGQQNQSRLTERNLQIAREVDRIAVELDATSAQVAVAWVRQRGEGIIPIVGVRGVEQFQDVLGSLEVELSAEHLTRLDETSRIALGFPYTLLQSPLGQLVYGDVEPKIELPSTAPYRWQSGASSAQTDPCSA